MVKQVLNYHDVQLYDADVALFGSFQWLNDNAINFYFQYVYHTVCLSSSEACDVLLVDPAVVSCMMLQCDDDDEYADLGRGLRVQEKTLCLLPVNDNQSFDSESSHWSLLVYENQRFVHYDSSAGHNTTAAKKIARTFLQLLSASGVDNVPTWSSGLFVNDRDAPQQQNGYDCGMYVLVVAEFLCRQRCRRAVEGAAAISLRDYATADRVTAFRLEIPRIVQRLQEDKAFAVQRS